MPDSEETSGSNAGAPLPQASQSTMFHQILPPQRTLKFEVNWNDRRELEAMERVV